MPGPRSRLKWDRAPASTLASRADHGRSQGRKARMRNGTTESESKVKEWLAGQGDAMVELLTELVNTDSGSYDKAGRRRGRRGAEALLHVRRAQARDRPAAALRRADPRRARPPAEQRPAADHPDGPSRHGVPQGRARAPALPHRERARLWAWRLRHEGGARDERLRDRGAEALRRHIRGPSSRWSRATRRSPRRARAR